MNPNNMIPACPACAHAVKRVEHLFNEASRLGLDYPTDKMLEDMVRDAEWNALWNPREIAEQHDQDMREMRRIWNRALGEKENRKDAEWIEKEVKRYRELIKAGYLDPEELDVIEPMPIAMTL